MQSSSDPAGYVSPTSTILRQFDMALDRISTANDQFFNETAAFPPTPAVFKSFSMDTPYTAQKAYSAFDTSSRKPSTAAMQSRTAIPSTAKPPRTVARTQSRAMKMDAINEDAPSDPAGVVSRNLASVFDTDVKSPGEGNSAPATNSNTSRGVKFAPATESHMNSMKNTKFSRLGDVPATPPMPPQLKGRSVQSAARAIYSMLSDADRHVNAMDVGKQALNTTSDLSVSGAPRSPVLALHAVDSPTRMEPTSPATTVSTSPIRQHFHDASLSATQSIDSMSVAERCVSSSEAVLEDLARFLSDFDVATHECKKLESNQNNATNSQIISTPGSFSKAIARHKSPVTQLEQLASTLALGFLPRLEDLRSNAAAVISSITAERSSWQRKLTQMSALVEDAKAGAAAAWLSKWQIREADWQKTVSSLRSRVAELETAAAASHEWAGKERQTGQADATAFERTLAVYKSALEGKTVELDTAQQHITELQQRLAHAQNASAISLSSTIASAIDSRGGVVVAPELRQVRDELASAQATLLSFKRAAQDLQNENKQLRSALERAQVAGSSSGEHHRELASRVVLLAAELEEKKRELAEEHMSTLRAMEECRFVQQRADAASSAKSRCDGEMAECHALLDARGNAIPSYNKSDSLQHKLLALFNADIQPSIPSGGAEPPHTPHRTESHQLGTSTIQTMLSGISDDVLASAGLRRIPEMSTWDRVPPSPALPIQDFHLADAAGASPSDPDVAIAVGLARAEERRAVLNDLRFAAELVGRKPHDLESALAAAHAAAAAAERENSRLIRELQALREVWSVEKLAMSTEVAQYQAALAQAESNLQLAMVDVGNAQKAVMASGQEAENVLKAARVNKEANSSQQIVLHNAISELQQEVVRLQGELRSKEQEMANASKSAAQHLDSALQRKQDEVKAQLRADLEKEQQRALMIVVEQTEARLKRDADDVLDKIKSQLATEKALAISRAQREWELQLSERVDALSKQHEVSLYEAVSTARQQEQLAAAAKLDAQAQAYESQIQKMELRVEEVKELAKKEILKRRDVHSKLMDLQGNIRVHVRIKPTSAQLEYMRAMSGSLHAIPSVRQLEADRSPANTPSSPLMSSNTSYVEKAASGCLIVRAPSGLASSDWAPGPAGGDLTAHGGQGNHKRTVFEFEFDEVHGPECSQESIFEYVRPMVEHALDGFNVTIFAYGQTGSGKTYTMEGSEDHVGIVKRALKSLMALGAQRAQERAHASGTAETNFSYRISMMEIYQERVRDLLAGVGVSHQSSKSSTKSRGSTSIVPSEKEIASIGVGRTDDKWASYLRQASETAIADATDNLATRETAHGVEVVGLSRLAVENVAEAMGVIRVGEANRSVGAHALNDKSSRSHMIIRVWVEGPAPTHAGGSKVQSVVNFVDLAGSERVLRTGAEGDRMKEAQAINSSLSALGNVVHALKKRATHVPFRDSKLTFVLRESLSGSSKVLMLCCVSGEERDVSESICSLQFAQRCRATALGAAARNTVGSAPVLQLAKTRSPLADRYVNKSVSFEVDASDDELHDSVSIASSLLDEDVFRKTAFVSREAPPTSSAKQQAAARKAPSGPFVRASSTTRARSSSATRR